jgi:hypothetical protein
MNKRALHIGSIRRTAEHDPIRVSRSQKERDLNMTQGRDRFRVETEAAMEAVIQEAIKKGFMVDSGRRKWSKRTGCYEIVWKSLIYRRPMTGSIDQGQALPESISPGAIGPAKHHLFPR